MGEEIERASSTQNFFQCDQLVIATQRKLLECVLISRRLLEGIDVPSIFIYWEVGSAYR